jgi:hypothetical protein
MQLSNKFFKMKTQYHQQTYTSLLRAELGIDTGVFNKPEDAFVAIVVYCKDLQSQIDELKEKKTSPKKAK